jgi:mannose-1-phosphate guanylyltransferase
MKAVILAGGLGTRLQPYTFFIPKPMLPLGNKPLLEHIIDWLTHNDNIDSISAPPIDENYVKGYIKKSSDLKMTGRKPKEAIDHIILCVSYLHRTIEDYFEDGTRFGVKIEYVRSERPLATAGQLKTAERMLDDTFVCLYGDSIYGFNLDKMINEHKRSKAFVSMALLSYKTNLKYGFIDLDSSGQTSQQYNNKVVNWREKPEVSGLINIGCYVMEPKFLRLIPKSSSFGMDSAVRKALEQNQDVRGFKIDSGFIDIGDKKSYLQAYKKYLKKLGKI